ncbi:MAG TPA: hypothetical protein PKD70_06360 [Saprospiraceae bacterium]|nr:hypothetical protein [Saprospiraceae bacterium]HMP13481.1 hypothetical protein [Saprospiraceae bacterium]
MPINYKNYPKDWQQIRKRILERAAHKCEGCGVPNYSLVERDTRLVKAQTESYAQARKEKKKHSSVIIIILTVAHLDWDEWNDKIEDDRLKALCQKCHLKYDQVDNKLRKKYGKQYRRFQLKFL